MTRMKFACAAATIPIVWDSDSEGLCSVERTGAREEKSLKVCFAFRRFLFGDCCCFRETLLGFWCLAAAIGRWRRVEKRRRMVVRGGEWRRMENDASDIVLGSLESEVILIGSG